MPSHTDFQPYLLPHTDAWALPEDQGIALLNHLENRGIKQVFCIPPIKKENAENSLDFLWETFETLTTQYTGNIELRLAACYRLDEDFRNHLQSGRMQSIGREIIVDVSPIVEQKNTWDIIRSIIEKGYTPVFFQPERCIYWNSADFSLLKEMGCKLILNLYSLFGYNGDYALMYSRELLQSQNYDYLFSGMEDLKIMHYSEQFSLDANDQLLAELKKLEDNGRALWASTEND